LTAGALDQIEALFGYAMALTRNQTDAEDLVQETYLRAVRACGTLQPGSNVKHWLFVILRNAWLNQLRHERGRHSFVELDIEEAAPGWPDSRASDPYVLYLRKLEQEEICDAIQSLPTLHREIIVLRDIEGFSYQEISNMLNCPAGTVMSRLDRARKKLRQKLGSRQTGTAARAV
jgi:RNA polymerase sigma-70 factor (ECF subfamily)